MVVKLTAEVGQAFYHTVLYRSLITTNTSHIQYQYGNRYVQFSNACAAPNIYDDPADTVTALSRSLLIIGNVWKEMAWVCYSVM